MSSSSRTWDDVFDGPPLAARQQMITPSSHSGTKRHRRHHKKDTANKRLDIQGLRMVAVVAVVVNHLTGHPQGGFVGVDVFFVISGYLITGHLVRESEKNRSISLFDFYRRRIRRLFPAALTVIAGTIVAAYLIFDSERFHSIVVDGFFAALFSANWRLIHTGTDYFTASGPTSPLQHYWSLSVEEQFYFVWPLVLIVTLAVGKLLLRSSSRYGRVPAAVAITGISAASLVYAAVASNDVVNYFSTFSRGWELGLGALLALLAPYVRGSNLILSLLSAVGLVMIAASLFVVTPAHFPFPAALLPCLGAGLVVAASSPTGRAINPILTNPVSTYLGDISYSVYVVHFPIIICMRSIRSDWDLPLYFVVTLLILGGSMLLYHLIENPIRQSDWLRPKRERGGDVGTEHGLKYGSLLGLTSGVAALAVLVLTAPAGQSAQYDEITAALGNPGASPGASGGVTPKSSDGPLLTKLQGQLADALRAQSWPKLSSAPNAERTTDVVGCGSKLSAPPDCTWGDGKKNIYLVGDSTSTAMTNAYVGMIDGHLLPDWRLRALGGAGCPFADKLLNTDSGNEHSGNCMGRNEQIVSEINQVKPDVVLLTAKAGTDDEIASQLGELKKIQANVGKFVIFPPNPTGKDPAECYNNLSVPADCVVKTGSGYVEELDGYRKLAKAVDGIFVDPTDFFCVSGYCPEFVGDTPVRRDGTHITEAYSELLTPIFYEQLKAQKVFE